MNPWIVVNALHHAASQVKEAGEFASAVLQRNIAVGAIVLLVCAVVAMFVWVKAKDKKIGELQEARVEDEKTHAAQLERMVKEHNEAMAQKAANVAQDYDKQRDKFIELIVQQTRLQEQMKATAEQQTTTMKELRADVRRLTGGNG